MRQIDGYVARVLLPGEQILYQGRVHWILVAGPVALAVFSAAILVPLSQAIGVLQPLAIIGLAAGGGGILLALIRQATDELTITTYRVVAKFGFISRTTFELRHEQIEGVQVRQTVLGRLLGYGSVAVSGTGGLIAPVPMIDEPLRFRTTLGLILQQRHDARAVLPVAGDGRAANQNPGQPPASTGQPAAGRRRKSHWDGL